MVDQPIQLLYTMTAVVIAGIYLYLPFAVLSIYTSLEKLGASLEEASMDLGAGPWTTFRRVTFPLSLAGVQAAVIFVFVPALGLFVTPALLGGANATMIGNLQVTIFKTSLDFALGSAVSFVVLAVALVAVALFGRSVDLERVYAGGVGQLTGRRGGPGHRRAGILGGYAALTYAFLFLPVAFLDPLLVQLGRGRGVPAAGIHAPVVPRGARRPVADDLGVEQLHDRRAVGAASRW